MRRAADLAGLTGIVLSGTLSLALLALLVGVLVANGVAVVSPAFLVTGARDFGAGGGVAHQIVGTLLLLLGTAAVALPVAVGAGLFATYYLGAAGRQAVGLVIYALNGVPSIVFGLFGLAVYVHWLGLGISLLTGSLILGTMILPTLVAAFREALDRVPPSQLEAAYAMGLGRGQVVLTVALPQSASGLATGLFLSLARAAGETAPIMFTATVFSGIGFPHSLLEPVPALQTHILFLAQEANHPVALANAWGASLVLLFLVFAMSGVAMWFRSARRIEVTT